MSMSTFEFNGTNKPYLVLERSWSLPAWAPIEREFITVPGRAGGVQTEMRTGMRRFSLPIIVRSKNIGEKKQFVEEMASWLIHEEAKPLTFSKYPGRTLYARVEGNPNFEQILNFGQGVIDIVCADPYEYGEKNVDFFHNGIVTVTNNGSATAPPVYEIDVLEDITHLDIISDKAYLRIGEPAPINEPVYQRQTLVLNDTMKTLIGWSPVTDIDDGYVTGTMVATQAGFEASTFGAAIIPEKKFQGPSLRRSLPEPLQNFRIDIPIELLNVSRETGMIEVYLLDAFSNTVAKIGFEDVWPTIKKNQGKFQLGNVDGRKVQHYRTANYAPAWNDFKGMLRLHRDGNRIRPYFAQVKEDGKHEWVSSAYVYTDIQGEYLAQITQVQVAIRKWPGDSGDEAKMRIGGIKVWRYNSPSEGMPVMASAGDKIIVDTIEGIVMINGEVKDDLKDHFSDFFDLPKGKTTLVLQPEDKVSGKVIVRERNL